MAPAGGSKRRPSRKSAGVANLSQAGVAALKHKLGLESEVKYLDVRNVNQVLTATMATLGSSGTYFAIPQGTTGSSRVGSDCRVKSVQTTVNISADAASVLTRSVRVIMYAIPDYRASSTNTTPAAILDTTSDIISPYNMDTQGYRILFDRTYRIGAANQPNAQKQFRISWRPKDWKLKWNDSDTTGAVAALEKGYYNFCAMTDVATNPPIITTFTRTKFVDN